MTPQELNLITNTVSDAASSALTLKNAVSAHRAWKTKLLAAATCGAKLDVATISRDDCCDLGIWLHSSGRRLYGGRPEFTNLVEKHSSFHAVASEAANVINSKGFEAGKTFLRGGSQFAYSTIEVVVAITLLKAVVDVGDSI
jgi:hypothetical protein